jgi:hypothetical protein
VPSPTRAFYIIFLFSMFFLISMYYIYISNEKNQKKIANVNLNEKFKKRKKLAKGPTGRAGKLPPEELTVEGGRRRWGAGRPQGGVGAALGVRGGHTGPGVTAAQGGGGAGGTCRERR